MTRTLSPVAVAYSILAGPILWFVQFVAVYALAEFGCRANFSNRAFVTPDSIRIFVIGITVIVLLAVGAGGLLAYSGWLRLQKMDEGDGSREFPPRFLSMMGMLLSALFLFSIVITAIPPFFVNVCDWVT